MWRIIVFASCPIANSFLYCWLFDNGNLNADADHPILGFLLGFLPGLVLALWTISLIEREIKVAGQRQNPEGFSES